MTDMAHQVRSVEIAEPPSLVAEAIIEALEIGDFHVFPDSMAKRVGDAYKSFVEEIVLVNLLED